MDRLAPSAGHREDWISVFARWACFLMFLGHAWIHLTSGIPLSDLLWKEAWMAPVAEGVFGMDWDAWSRESLVENGMTAITRCAGIFYLGCAIVTMTRVPRIFAAVWMLAGTLGLLGLAFLKYLSGNMIIGHFLEQSCQVMMPITYLAVAVYGCRCQAFASWLKIPIALTFVFHGLFAVGFSTDLTLPIIGAIDYAVPGNFLEMVHNCLNLEPEPTARNFLMIAGILDFVAAILLLVPRTTIWGLAYMIPWGLATAIARPWAYFESAFAWETLARWIPEMLYRVPHFGLPVILLGIMLSLRKR